ncbi:hypothetical protein O7A70_31460 [Mesorhizobium sp. Cs1299R1N1]|uniref:hypothetical protein n=1 Tax=Mesorhizobium sp. Cs1299R1N1 TaxID=3015172 RepID=UPI00301D5DF3
MISRLGFGHRDLEQRQGLLRLFERQTEIVYRQPAVCPVDCGDLLWFDHRSPPSITS